MIKRKNEHNGLTCIDYSITHLQLTVFHRYTHTQIIAGLRQLSLGRHGCKACAWLASRSLDFGRALTIS